MIGIYNSISINENHILTNEDQLIYDLFHGNDSWGFIPHDDVLESIGEIEKGTLRDLIKIDSEVKELCVCYMKAYKKMVTEDNLSYESGKKVCDAMDKIEILIKRKYGKNKRVY